MTDQKLMDMAETAPVTVLVPTFNRAHFLGQALDSLLAQHPAPAEIIVIDDGSDDGTADLVARYAPRVGYLRQSNSGKATALNNGMARTTQPFVWIFDDDDIAAPGTLASLYGALAAKDNAGYAYGLCDKFYGEWPCTAERERNTAYQADDHQALYIRLLEDFFLWQGAMLVRRSCYDAVGPFDVRLNRSQDYEMALRLVRAFPGVAVPIVAFHQRHHEGVRGPKQAQISAANVDAAWRKFNHMIFSEIYRNHDLAEYVVGCGNEMLDREVVTALIQRGCIMARRGLWQFATADFQLGAAQARTIGLATLNEQEKSALRRVFERGARSDFQNPAEARSFFGAVATFPGSLAEAIKGNLMLPLTYRLRRATSAERTMAELGQLWLAGRHMFGRLVFDHYLDARRTNEGMFKVKPLLAAG